MVVVGWYDKQIYEIDTVSE